MPIAQLLKFLHVNSLNLSTCTKSQVIWHQREVLHYNQRGMKNPLPTATIQPIFSLEYRHQKHSYSSGSSAEGTVFFCVKVDLYSYFKKWELFPSAFTKGAIVTIWHLIFFSIILLSSVLQYKILHKHNFSFNASMLIEKKKDRWTSS